MVLLGAPHRILTRDQLIELSRLHNDEVYNRAVDLQVMRLRRKIEGRSREAAYIKTERGNGYVFSVNVETSTVRTLLRMPPPPSWPCRRSAPSR